MSQILLIRPGCTDFDEQHRVQGTLDLPLSTHGQQQVARIVQELGEVPIDMIYTSPCEPARSTAAALGAARGIPVKEIESLYNVNHGLWQGLKVDEIRRKHPKVFKQWQESPQSICPPGGETLTEAVNRVRKALEKPMKKKGRLAVVAADPLAAIICSVVRGEMPDLIPGACSGACGNWEYLTDGNGSKSASGEFATVNLAPARTTS
jgi:broad specificity phosphatase PhoE